MPCSNANPPARQEFLAHRLRAATVIRGTFRMPVASYTGGPGNRSRNFEDRSLGPNSDRPGCPETFEQAGPPLSRFADPVPTDSGDAWTEPAPPGLPINRGNIREPDPRNPSDGDDRLPATRQGAGPDPGSNLVPVPAGADPDALFEREDRGRPARAAFRTARTIRPSGLRALPFPRRASRAESLHGPLPCCLQARGLLECLPDISRQ